MVPISIIWNYPSRERFRLQNIAWQREMASSVRKKWKCFEHCLRKWKILQQSVYKEDGSVDLDASRRVEILFRLQDEEMIDEMMGILKEK